MEPPDLLASTVRTALEEWTDMDQVQQVEDQAEVEQEEIRDRLAEIEF